MLILLTNESYLREVLYCLSAENAKYFLQVKHKYTHLRCPIQRTCKHTYSARDTQHVHSVQYIICWTCYDHNIKRVKYLLFFLLSTIFL